MFNMFGKRLKELRKAQNFMQIDMASYLDVSVQSYSAYENGREPNYDTLSKLAKRFNVSTDYLLGFEQEGNEVFHKRLKELVKESGKTQAAIAKEVGMIPQAFSYYLNGREPNYETLNKLADYFNVTTDYLLGRQDRYDITPVSGLKAERDNLKAELKQLQALLCQAKSILD